MPSIQIYRNTTAAVLFALSATACESYSPEPLDFPEILDRITAARRAESRLTFSTAVVRLLDHGPGLTEARAALLEAEAVQNAGVPSVGNPSLSAALLFLDGPGLTGSLKRGFEAALGIALPLGGRVGATRDLDEAERDARQIALVSTIHRGFLDLRETWCETVFAQRELELIEARVALTKKIVDRTRSLADSGRASGIELRTAEMESSDAETELLQAHEELVSQRARLAELCGLSLDSVGRLDDRLPKLTEIRDVTTGDLRDHPDLRELAADYRVREHELRLEITKQYPDFVFAPSFEREAKTDRWGLGIGIDLPMFDRNQRGIAAARARRAGQRERFERKIRELMADLELAQRLLALAHKSLAASDAKLRSSDELRALARRGVESGTLPPWRYFETERRYAEAARSRLTKERDLYRRHIALERATGQLWLRFDEHISRDKIPADRDPSERKDR